MVKFLKSYGVNDSVISTMSRVNSDANLYNFNCNQDEIVEIIKFFNNIGIKCIDQLLIYKIEIFFRSFSDIRKMFSSKDIENIVEQINKDYTFIDTL